MARKHLQTSIPGVGFVFRPTYRDRKGDLKHSSKWSIRLADGTQRPTGLSDQAAAFEELLKLAGGIAAGTQVSGRGTVGELIDLALQDGKRRRSFVDKKQRLEVIRKAIGDVRVSDFRRSHAERFCENLDVSEPTKNRYMAELRRAFRIGTQQEPPLCARVPLLPMFEESDPKQGTLTPDGYAAMRDALADQPAVRLFLVIAYHVGMRANEIMRIRFDQVDLTNGVMRLSASQTKGKAARVVPIYGEMRAHIEMAFAIRDARCPFLIQRDGKSLTHGKLKGPWGAAAALAGVQVTPHDLRRTALTNMTAAGIPTHEAMAMSGHKTRSVFDRYNISNERTAKAAGERMAEFMQRHEPNSKEKPH